MSSRINNTRRNIFASYILMIVQIFFSFVSRAVIVYTLGAEYLGLSSLFASVLQVLNIVESGFSSSVIYFMYKPLADGNTAAVCALLNYLQKVYRWVGTVILVAGILVTPFIDYLIKGDVPEDINIHILYILYLVNTSISYFLFAYKTSFLTAIQRLDLTKIANTIVIFIQYGMQLVALVVFHNYYLFVISMIIGTASINIFTAYISKKKFPAYVCSGIVDKKTKSDIINKVKALLICNISSVAYSSLDSIIISTYIGLSAVAIYNNYYVIFGAMLSLIAILRSSMQASVGNSLASETKEKNLNDLYLWQFLFSLIATVCTTCMICLYQPFMVIWMGENMLLPFIDVILLGIWFIVLTVQHPFYLYLSAAGLWNEVKWAYIFSTVLNLIMNIVLGSYFGITGIILASLLDVIITGLLWQCTIILKGCFNISSKGYILNQCGYLVIATCIVIITYASCSFITMGGIWELSIKAIICITVVPGLLIAAYYRSPYFRKSRQLFMKFIQRY